MSRPASALKGGTPHRDERHLLMGRPIPSGFWDGTQSRMNAEMPDLLRDDPSHCVPLAGRGAMCRPGRLELEERPGDV